MNLFLDIETIPIQAPGALEEIRATIEPPGNISKPESIAKWMAENADAKAEDLWRKTALDGTQGEIVTIGFAGYRDDVCTAYRGFGTSEGDLLQNAFDAMAQYDLDGVRVVGHGVGFDVRFLFQRAVILGIKPPFSLPVDRRYNDDRMFCTMLAWAGWGNRISLADLCAALGITVKSNGLDGSLVWDYIKAGRQEEVAAYCAEDVEAVRQVFYRLNFSEWRAA